MVTMIEQITLVFIRTDRQVQENQAQHTV